MQRKILSIINTAYRATLEEQDDAALWFNHACVLAGADIDILLTGNAVNYAIKTDDISPLTIGKREVSHPSHFGKGLTEFQSCDQKVFYLEEDLLQRGISLNQLVKPFYGVKKKDLSNLVDSYDMVWRW